MKKMFVLALAMVALANVAHAAPGEGKDGKSAADRARDAVRASGHAKEAGHTAPEVGHVRTAIETSRFGNELSASQRDSLNAGLDDATIREAAKKIAASKHAANSTLGKLDSARMEGLANMSKIPSSVRNLTNAQGLPEGKAQRAYIKLVLGAGEKAAGWPETTQKNMIEFLTKANELLLQGKSFDQALTGAKEDLKATSKVDIDLKKIDELC